MYYVSILLVFCMYDGGLLWVLCEHYVGVVLVFCEYPAGIL